MQFIGVVEDANLVNDGSYAFIVSPKTKARWKVIPAAVNYPKYLWEGKVPGDVALGAAKGFQTKMMDNGFAWQVLFGKWSECLMCQWSGVDMVTDPY